MSAYDLDILLQKWERADLSVEQAVGQLLLLLQTVTRRIGQLEKSQQELRAELKKKERTVDSL